MKTLLAEAEEKELSVVELKATEAGYPIYKKIGFSDDVSKYHLMKWTKAHAEREQTKNDYTG